MNSLITLTGWCLLEMFDEFGNLKGRAEGKNLITQVGDRMYVERAAGINTLSAPQGMRLGTQVTPAAATKTGTASTLQAFLTGSSVAFDATYPLSSGAATPATMQYKCTWGPGVATTASAITEVVLTNDTVATVWSAGSAGIQANTIARFVPAAGAVGAKAATDTLAMTWTHSLQGS